MIVSKRLHLSLLWATRVGRIQTSFAIIVTQMGRSIKARKTLKNLPQS